MADMYGNYGMPYGGMVGVNPNQQFYNYDYGYNQPLVMNQNNGYVPKSTLSQEEAEALRNKPGNGLDLMNIPVEESFAGICNHVGLDGREAVHMLPDGSCECDICKQRWNPQIVSKEEVEETTSKMIDYMQNVKFANVLPIQTVRDYFTLIPLLNKFPSVYDYAMKQIDRQVNGNNMYGAAQDASMYAQYRNVMYNAPYQNPVYGGYQPQQPYGQQMGYYNQQPAGYGAPMAQAAQPGVNPMDINAGQAQNAANYAAPPVYGQPMQQPYGAPMGQPYYGGPMGQPPQAPMYGAPMQQPVYGQPMPAPQPAAPAPAPTPTTTPDGATVQNNGDGTATSSKKITLS